MRLALAVVLIACGACALADAPARARLPVSVVEDEAQLLRSSSAAREHALDDWASLGADVVRVIVPWERAVADPGLLERLDEAVAGARQRGLDVLLDPSGPGPAAASRCRPRRGVCAPSPTAFGAWVASLGRQYPSVRRWSIWNEPNNPSWLQPQHVGSRARSPELYRELVRAGVAALRRSGHAQDTILIGETAPMPAAGSRPAAERPVAADTFVRAMLAGRRPLGATGVAHHPYTTDLRSPLGTSAVRQYTLAGLARLRRVVRAAAARGVVPRGAPTWLTEMGFQTNPPDAFFGVSPARQALWIAAAEWRATASGAAAVAQYLLVDERPTSSFQSGLRFADGRAKPAFAAYRLPLTLTRRGARVALWGRVRPVRRAGVRVGLERRGHDVRVVRRLRTEHGGVVRAALRLPPGGALRLRWDDAATGRIFHGAWVALPPGRR